MRALPLCVAYARTVATVATVACAACAACAGSSGPPPGPRPAPAVIATPRLADDDVEVARVNGHPVWASCVTAQAAGLGAGSAPGARRAAALDQCLAFELLAQTAEARGLAAAPEVVEAARRAAVDRVVETEFEQRYRGPADLQPALDAVMQNGDWRLHTLELRASSYARFVVPAHAAPELEARAHALADRLASELAGQTGLYSVHLAEAARRIAAGGGVELQTIDFRPAHHDDLVDAYAAALYAIPAVGQSSPAFRSPWGWDVLLWTGGIEAAEHTRAQVMTGLFPEVRRREFQRWVSQLAKQLGLHIELDQQAIGKLDSDAPGAAP